jgi:hypothetical protein
VFVPGPLLRHKACQERPECTRRRDRARTWLVLAVGTVLVVLVLLPMLVIMLVIVMIVVPLLLPPKLVPAALRHLRPSTLLLGHGSRGFGGCRMHSHISKRCMRSDG